MGASDWPFRVMIRSARVTAMLLAAILAVLPLLADQAHGALTTTRLDWGSKTPMPTARDSLGLAAAPNGKLYAVGGYLNDYRNEVEEYDPATNTWSTKLALATARKTLGLAAAPNGKLYAVGGFNGGPLDKVEEYDPATNASWATKDPMPTARQGVGLAAAANGKLYAVGGSNDSFLDKVEEYDPATNTWTNCGVPKPGNACPSLATARIGLGLAAAPNGKLYAVGGYNFGYLDKVEEYDPATNASWATKPPLPAARELLGLAAAPNGKLYAVGGRNNFNLDKVEEYDPAANTWATTLTLSTAAPYPARTAAASAVFGGRIYIMGGLNGSAPVSTAFEYTPATNLWRQIDSMPTERFAATAVTANGKIYVVGGYNSALGGFLPTVEELTPPLNGVGLGVWRHANSPSPVPQLPFPRAYAGLATAQNGKIYLAGGGSSDGVSNLVVEYDPLADTAWRGVASMLIARDGVGLALAGDGRLYAVGGENAPGGSGGSLVPLATVEAFTPPTTPTGLGSWSGPSGIAQLPQPRWDHALVGAPNGKLYLTGGSSTNGAAPTPAADAYEYDPAANTWSSLNGQVIRGRMPTARYGHALAIIGQRLFAIGGAGGLNTFEAATVTDLPSVSAGGPYAVATGASVQLTGVGADPEGSALAFAWDLNNDLLYETSGQNPTFSAVGLPAGTVRTVRVRAADALGAYGLASTTVTVTQNGCGPRPNVTVTTAKLAAGQLQATLTAHTNASTPTNRLISIRFTAINNAAVRLNGSPVTAGPTITLPAGAQQATLLIDRHAPAQNPGLASTVAFAVSDLCGEWKSFVGGGSGAF
jgi:N-acetylneuraminic acid mutarotase